MRVTADPPPRLIVTAMAGEPATVTASISERALHPRLLALIGQRQIIISIRNLALNKNKSSQERTFTIETMLQSLDPQITGKYIENSQEKDQFTLAEFLALHGDKNHAISIVLEDKIYGGNYFIRGIRKDLVQRVVEVTVMLIPFDEALFARPSFKSFVATALMVNPSLGQRVYDAGDQNMSRIFLAQVVPLYFTPEGQFQKVGEDALVETPLWGRLRKVLSGF